MVTVNVKKEMNCSKEHRRCFYVYVFVFYAYILFSIYFSLFIMINKNSNPIPFFFAELIMSL